MKSIRRAGALACLAFVLLTATRLEAQTQIGIAIGSRPESLALETMQGDVVDLAQVIGHRPLLLQFWASWCRECEELRPRMLAAHEEFGKRVEFFGVAVAVGQKPRTVRRHLEKEPLPYPMLWDARGEAVRAFMVPVTSYIVILNAEGSVAYTGVDSEQDITGVLRRLFGANHSTSEDS